MDAVTLIQNLGMPVGLLVYILWIGKMLAEKFGEKSLQKFDTMIEQSRKLAESFDMVKSELAGLRREVAELRRISQRHEKEKEAEEG